MLKKTSIFLLFLFVSCSSKVPVRHLTSDVCLIIPENNTISDVKSDMGEPDKIIKNDKDNSEIWIYYQVHKSFLKKIPLIKRKFGHEEYDLVMITFKDKLVKKCSYRSLSKKDMLKFGIEPGE